MSKRSFALVALAAVAVLAAACGSDGGSTPPATTSAPGVVVGSIASTTGSGAPYGQGQLQGQQLALDLLAGPAGVQAALAQEDDGSTEAGGVAAMEALLAQGAVAVLGPTLSPVAAAADPVAQRAGVPVLAVTNTTLDIDAIGDRVWRVSLSERAMVPQAIAAAQERDGTTTAALVWDGADGYATGAAEAFRAGATAHGVALVADVAFTPGAGQAEAALAQAATGQPQALYLAARSAAAVELLLAAQALGLAQARVGGNGFNSPEVLSGAGGAAEGLVVAASWNVAVANPDNAAFVAAYRSRFGTEPDAFAAQGYAGVQVLLAAVAAGGGTSPAQVQAGLTQLGTVPTVLGDLRFAGREADYRAAVQVVRDGAFALLGPA